MEENDDKSCPPPIGHAPWLVYTHGNAKARKIQTFCSISPFLPPNNKSYVKSIPQLRGHSILASFGDWLILRGFSDKMIFSLWNIVTSQRICLPELYALEDTIDDDEVEISACVLTSPPDDDNNGNCAILLFYKSVVFSCGISRETASNWVEQSTELDGETVEVDNVVTCNGVIYGWAQTSCGGVLITIEFGEDRDSNSIIFKSLRLKAPEFGLCFHSPKVLNYLVESCGGLYMISIRIWQADSMHISKAKVWELDLSQTSWVEVESLGNRAFFLGIYSCTWCWGSTEPESDSLGGGIEGNCVYFALEDDETLYSYRLQDDSFTFLLTCPHLLTPFYGPTWVLPRHQRLLPKEVLAENIMEKVDMFNLRANVIKHEELQEQNEKQEKLLCTLAPDIIALVSKYLHFFDYLNFRASCKAFQSAVPPAQSRANNSFPLLMFSKNVNGLCELKDICRNNSHSIMIPRSPSVPTAIEFSKDGWLVVCTGGESLQFFNLFTRVRGEFPPCDYMHMFASVGFSTCPTSSNCLTVGILDGWEYVMVNFIHSSDDRWHHHEFCHGDVEFTPSHCSPVYHNGAFYFLDQVGYLGMFELVKGEASWKVYDRPETWDDVLDSCHLLKCDKELVSVFFGKTGKWVQVFKFNHSSKNWDEVKTLENHILFIGPSSSFSVIAREREMRNRIYLPKRKGNEIVFYSLETGKYHTVRNEDPMDDFYGMRGQSLCCWV